MTVISVLISSFAAYSMVRFRYRFRGLIGRLILFAYLTPTSLLFIPLSIVMAQLKLGNSLNGLILVYLTFSLPLSTWLLQGYFRGVPRELEEQAMIDGLSRLGALFRIVLPLSAPGLAAVGDLHLHRRLERAAARAGPHHLGSAAHGAARAQLPDHQRRAALGPADGRRGALVGAADDPLFRRPALHGAGMTAGSVKG